MSTSIAATYGFETSYPLAQQPLAANGSELVRAIGDFALKRLPKVTLAVALIWLALRLAQVFLIPRPVLEEILGLQQPDMPEITIDRLGDSWVHIRIMAANISLPAAKILIYLDGKITEVKTTNGPMSFKELQPGTEYTLRAMAVTGLGRKSKEFRLKFSTLKYADERASKSGPSVQLISAEQYETVKPGSSEPMTDDNYDKSKIKQTVQAIADLQHEIQEVFEQQKQENAEFVRAQNELKQEKENLAETRKRNEHQRAAIKSEVLELEEQRRHLESQREKLGREFDELENKMELMDDQEAEWSRDMLQWSGELAQELEDEQQGISAVQKQAQELKAQLQNYSQEEKRLETELSELASKGREASTLLEQMEAVVEDIMACVDTSTGLLHRPIVLEILESSGLPLEYRRQIMEDLDLDEEKEQKWESDKARLKAEYNMAYQLFKSSSRLLESATAKAQAQSHVQQQFPSSQSSLNARPSLSRQSSMNSQNTRSSFSTAPNSLYSPFRQDLGQDNGWPFRVQQSQQQEQQPQELEPLTTDENLLPSDLFAEDHQPDDTPKSKPELWPQRSPSSWKAPQSTYDINPWQSQHSFDNSRNSSAFFNSGAFGQRQPWPRQVLGQPSPLGQPASLHADVKPTLFRTSSERSSSDSSRRLDLEQTPKATPEKNRWKLLNRSSEKTASLVRRLSFFNKKDKEVFKSEIDSCHEEEEAVENPSI